MVSDRKFNKGIVKFHQSIIGGLVFTLTPQRISMLLVEFSQSMIDNQFAIFLSFVMQYQLLKQSYMQLIFLYNFVEEVELREHQVEFKIQSQALYNWLNGDTQA